MPATDSTTLPVLDVDTVGNANLAEAAHRTGIRRFVLAGNLTSDQTPQVPHF